MWDDKETSKLLSKVTCHLKVTSDVFYCNFTGRVNSKVAS